MQEHRNVHKIEDYSKNKQKNNTDLINQPPEILSVVNEGKC